MPTSPVRREAIVQLEAMRKLEQETRRTASRLLAMIRAENHQRTGLCLLFVSATVGILCWAVATARLRGLILNSALLTVGTLAIGLPLGTFLAVVVSKTSVAGRQVIRQLMMALLFVPLVVQATSWQAAIGPSGWLLPGVGNPLALRGWYGAIWVHGMGSIAWVVLFVGAALSNVPRELEEDALQDGSAWRVLLRVSLRRALAGVVAAALWIAVICFGEITITDL
ncbi:MAG: ABC transporter permease subunit, partial [Pirellulales bacterium]|nr:ABC transporter permease subunit [Pirellulales bacterium]